MPADAREQTAETTYEAALSAKNQPTDTIERRTAASAQPDTLTTLLVALTKPFARWMFALPTSDGRNRRTRA